MKKSVHVLAVIKESYDYLLKHLSLMKYYWVAVISSALLVHKDLVGPIPAEFLTVASVIAAILLTAMAVSLVRLVVKKEPMSWSNIVKQYSEGHFWRYMGTGVLGALLLMPALIFVIAMVFEAKQFSLLWGGDILMLAIGFVCVVYFLFIICLLAIAMVHAASGERKSIRTAYQLMKGSVVRFFGGLLLASIPYSIIFSVVNAFYSHVVKAMLIDGGAMAIASVVAYLVLAFFQVFFALLVTIYSAQYYVAIKAK